ncbi:sigma transcription factor [Salmonella phage vB_SenAc-pSC20]|nr:sigma transcription factor [Salmonella phage vB_SenAc-pSC20]
MGMNFVDRGDNVTKYFTDEDNDRVVGILRDWIPARKKALAEGTPLPRIPNYVAMNVQMIIKNMSMRYNYRDYPYREDMVSEAVVNILRYLHTFDVSHIGKKGKINFFSWVTMCADRSFAKKLTSEEEHNYIKLRSFEEAGGFAALSDDPDFQQQTFVDSTGITMDFRERIGNFETKKEAQREKERQKQIAIKEEEKNKKIPRGILQCLTKSENTITADAEDNSDYDFGSTQFNLEDEICSMEPDWEEAKKRALEREQQYNGDC